MAEPDWSAEEKARLALTDLKTSCRWLSPTRKDGEMQGLLLRAPAALQNTR